QVVRVVGCGYPGSGQGVRLCIVDADGRGDGAPVGEGQGAETGALGGSEAVPAFREVSDGTVGEVWVCSPSKAQGYWGQPQLSAEEFHAPAPIPAPASVSASSPVATAPVGGEAGAEDSGQNGFLRTGDLGFMHQGELFICGRLKDLIIVRGANHYPQDIERAAEAQCTQLRAGCSAAFSLKSGHGNGNGKVNGSGGGDGGGSGEGSGGGGGDRGTEDVVYVAELKDSVKTADYPSITASIRDAISSGHGLGLSVVCLLKTRSVPKTTSGKIARAWCRRGFTEGSLQVLYRDEGNQGTNLGNPTVQEGGRSGARIYAEEGVEMGAGGG
ncbi:hypothetical protein B484DRAFT_389772, partial [Ochromonadaceae sp. CCMP2298]